ncbi:hypothetical protein [Mycobacteroides abscessus]|uniref:hypothetical protein n=1 Tax=Mycobacteroides abscessus TaxID=36809 RepID=UPI000928D431|nr:hypothetical protein [Mycobacteroides abscessus]SIK93727.1 Uncharacterised protein [Mycobacteroides abscessus subsp. abscessus]SIN01919.1 Uncharacterised protein [Mycobacteroides abscessus subsp. abscessus]SIN10514.1 Uncharacterised protein [Mycobacteroides abscessus subsp. abscessus]
MANKKTMEEARKEARERLVQASQDRATRERLAINDAAALVRARTRCDEVAQWHANRLTDLAAEADRKRLDHDKEAAAAVGRLRARGETVAMIALLAGITEGEVRKYIRLAKTLQDQLESTLDALPEAAAPAAGELTSADEIAPSGLSAHDGAVRESA